MCWTLENVAIVRCECAGNVKMSRESPTAPFAYQYSQKFKPLSLHILPLTPAINVWGMYPTRLPHLRIARKRNEAPMVMLAMTKAAIVVGKTPGCSSPSFSCTPDGMLQKREIIRLAWS